MKRTFAIPFVAALVGGAVVAVVIAAAGGLGSSTKHSHDGPVGAAVALERIAGDAPA